MPSRCFYKQGQDYSSTVGNIYLKSYIADESRPLVFAFSHYGGIVSRDDIAAGVSPWAYDFLKKRNVNVMAFAPIKGHMTYYRDAEFLASLPTLSASLPAFTERLAYGGSMGGYAASAFANALGVDRLLLLNPITSRKRSIATWDYEAGRMLDTFKHDWSGPYTDGAEADATGYVVYDPLHELDRKHAKRYKNLTHLKTPGIGHWIPVSLAQLGMLGWLVDSFLAGTDITDEFHRKIRKRREHMRYYTWMLSKENRHLTPKRQAIIARHHNLYTVKTGNKEAIERGDVIKLIYAAIKLEKTNLPLAYELASIAKRIRPDGPVISKKYQEYKTRYHQQQAQKGHPTLD